MDAVGPLRNTRIKNRTMTDCDGSTFVVKLLVGAF